MLNLVTLRAEGHTCSVVQINSTSDQFTLAVGPDPITHAIRSDQFTLAVGPDPITLAIGPDPIILAIWSDQFTLAIWSDQFTPAIWSDQFTLAIGPDTFTLAIGSDQSSSQSGQTNSLSQAGQTHSPSKSGQICIYIHRGGVMLSVRGGLVLPYLVVRAVSPAFGRTSTAGSLSVYGASESGAAWIRAARPVTGSSICQRNPELFPICFHMFTIGVV
ncbi:hypothetical protein MAR_012564 [Mya arenaria]|uniref:Uncharacterized protein n=1 Tax=Mya arenaria TaxID=6604 RepID=A0ABY7FXD2_MYAAR|nr:hypothetical protein MAR_012564 [Mya arenaria]